ncbi:MAG TPA: hypothetical protein GX497_06355 [Bacillus bacterium]|nr:hypothetical protein [Bacillus sp. (in: firmicutes)]
MSKYLNVKLLGLLICCTAFILVISQLGSKAYETVFNGKNIVFSNGTMISTISLEGMTKQEAETVLINKIQEWSKTSSFSIQYQNTVTELPDNVINIDAKASIQTVVDGQQTELVVAIDKSQVEEAINKTVANQDVLQDIDFAKVEESLLHSVQQFQNQPVRLQLLAYLKTDGENASKELAVSSIKGIAKEYINIEAILAEQEEIEIGANETISFRSLFEINEFDSEALSMIATGIYNVILPSNFTIIERNISKQLPPYSELGLEAKVSDKMDLLFTNPNPYPYKLTFDLGNDTLQVKLSGPPFPYQYSIKKETASYIPKTVIQFSAKLSPTQTKILDNGKKGLLAKVYREAKDDYDQIVETTFISEDFYPPEYRVAQLGLMPKETNENNNNRAVDLDDVDNSSEDLNSTNMLSEEQDEEASYEEPI